MSSVCEKTKFFYNIAEASVIVGKPAYEASLEAGVVPEDIAELAGLLTGRVEIPDTSNDPLDVNNWSHDDYISYGKWLLTVIDSPLRHRVLQNAYLLGIGPEPQRIYRKDSATNKPRFDGYRDFYSQIQAPDTIKRGLYEDLTFPKLMRYVKKQADRLAEQGIRPTVGRFDELAKKEKGPSNEIAKRITGHPYGRLLDMAGYPEPRNWSDNDFIEWGVRYMIANDGQKPTFSGITELSKRFRGPSDSSIARRFGGIWSFQTIVMERFEAHIKEQDSEKNRKLLTIEKELENGTMPGSLIEGCDSSSLFTVAAKFWVARGLLPSTADDELVSLATTARTSDFVGKLKRRDPNINLAHIEVIASKLGLFEDLWPPQEEFREYLKVTC